MGIDFKKNGNIQCRLEAFPKWRPRAFAEIRESNLLTFPAAAFEEDDAGGSNGGFRDNDGPKDAVGVLEHDHSVGIADIAVTENAEAGGGQRNNGRVVGEKPHRGLGEKDEENADGAEKNHVPEARTPDGSFGALGLLGAEVLSDERGGGVAESPARQDDENENANGDGVAGER